MEKNRRFKNNTFKSSIKDKNIYKKTFSFLSVSVITSIRKFLRVVLKKLGLDCLDFNLNDYSNKLNASILTYRDLYTNKVENPISKIRLDFEYKNFYMWGRRDDLSNYISKCINDPSFLVISNKTNMGYNKLQNVIFYSTLTELSPYLKKYINFYMKAIFFEVIGKRVKNHLVQLLKKGRKINIAKVRRWSYLLIYKLIIKRINVAMNKYILGYTKKNTRDFLVKFGYLSKSKLFKRISRRKLKVYYKLMKRLYLVNAASILSNFIQLSVLWSNH